MEYQLLKIFWQGRALETHFLLSVFYESKNPNSFIKGVRDILDKRGIFILEHADLLSIIKNNLFDTICHEHLEYYSSKVIIDIINRNRLKVFDQEYNDINGGSSRYYICHKNANYKKKHKKIYHLLLKENKVNLYSTKTYKVFFKKILHEKNKLKKIIRKIKNK